MKKRIITVIVVALWIAGVPQKAFSQQTDSLWTLQKCIDYALNENIQIRKSTLNSEIYEVNVLTTKANRFPTVTASVGQNFSWSKGLESATQYGSYANNSNTSAAINASVVLYNGNKTSNAIKQAEINKQVSEYNTKTQQETIELNVLNAYLQVLFAEEQVNIYKKQIELTNNQASLAEERMKTGLIAKSDYLQIRSELASEKQSLANAESTLSIARVNLMQLLELPVNERFAINHPIFDSSINEHRSPDAQLVYNQALAIKPQIQSAELNKQAAEISIKMAKAGLYPSLILSSGISTGASNPYTNLAYNYQLQNRITPSIGLTLSIPIYQNRQTRSSIDNAKINTHIEELNTIEVKNQLRKSIEQACADVSSAEKEYEASLEGQTAAMESHEVAAERYKQGVINSVDYLIQKTNLIKAESQLLQSKYNLLFSYKTLDFYSGSALTL